MADTPLGTVPLYLPAELVAKIEELKRDREEDRDKTVEDLVRELCQGYVDVRQMARLHSANREKIEKAYREIPDPWDDADVWAEAYPPDQDELP